MYNTLGAHDIKYLEKVVIYCIMCSTLSLLMSDPSEAPRPGNMDDTQIVPPDELSSSNAMSEYLAAQESEGRTSTLEGWEDLTDVIVHSNMKTYVSCGWRNDCFQLSLSSIIQDRKLEDENYFISSDSNDKELARVVFHEVLQNPTKVSDKINEIKKEKTNAEMLQEEEGRKEFIPAPADDTIGDDDIELSDISPNLDTGDGYTPPPVGWENLDEILRHEQQIIIIICDWHNGAFRIAVSLLLHNKQAHSEERIISTDPNDADLARAIFEVFVADPKCLIEKIEAAKLHKESAAKSSAQDPARQEISRIRKALKRTFGWLPSLFGRD